MTTERCPFNGVDCEYIPMARRAEELEAKVKEQQKEIDQLKGMVLNLLSKEFEHVKVIKPKKGK